jgi:ribosomal protein L7Ae-like RNA K-turn-binding protein
LVLFSADDCSNTELTKVLKGLSKDYDILIILKMEEVVLSQVAYLPIRKVCSCVIVLEESKGTQGQI